MTGFFFFSKVAVLSVGPIMDSLFTLHTEAPPAAL